MGFSLPAVVVESAGLTPTCGKLTRWGAEFRSPDCAQPGRNYSSEFQRQGAKTQRHKGGRSLEALGCRSKVTAGISHAQRALRLGVNSAPPGWTGGGGFSSFGFRASFGLRTSDFPLNLPLPAPPAPPLASGAREGRWALWRRRRNRRAPAARRRAGGGGVPRRWRRLDG